MEKLYSAINIKSISEQFLIYEDESGNEQTIDLKNCRDNWYNNYNKKESLISKLLQKRKKCKYIGDRFLGQTEAYFLFYSDTTIKFIIEFNANMELDDVCEARHYFEHIKDQLRKAGWITFDVG
jgi:hypothetical protein